MRSAARVTVLTLCFCVLTLSWGQRCYGQSTKKFPDKPVTFVVAFGVGGSADRMTRLMARYIADELGQPIQVINKPGAGTLLGANFLLSRPHDGYTVLASGFSPYLSNTILDGSAKYSIKDFAYLNFQWFDEDIIALSKRSKYKTLGELMHAIKTQPKKVKGTVVRGSAGHLMAKMLLELNGIPQGNMNLVAYNDGGKPRAAVAGGVVDFIVISAQGSEAISDYITPVAMVSDRRNSFWDAPTLPEALEPLGMSVPLIPGSIRGFATSAKTREKYPERFDILTAAIERALKKPEVQKLLKRSSIGGRWIGPEESMQTMKSSFDIFKNYSYLLKLE
ncbi:MAG: tripartite tricarboxylate transporter substrate binding protein [Spongiibacteraceae bacterium]|nr:tripartite tricarboxylate transporter substrate binding protein [Spongiibacteraceae bacterium]